MPELPFSILSTNIITGGFRMFKAIATMVVLSLVVLILAAANPWLARLTVINQTGEDIYISMDYPYTWLTVKADDDLGDDEKPKTIFTIERDVYNARVFACGMTATGKINMDRNLRLNFTPCELWPQTDTPKYLGEPSQEKPNWFRTPGMAEWQFYYSAEN
jgi:hypothetical protein